MTGERPHVPEPSVSGAMPGAVDEPEWRARLRTDVERAVRQRAARAEHRRVLSTRRKAGLEARQATRLARLDATVFDEP
jgi:hypothetical protein